MRPAAPGATAPSRRSRRRRASSRGHALAECTIVMVPLAVLLVNLEAFSNYYVAKVEVQQTARSRNMINATDACEPEGDVSIQPLSSLGVDPPDLGFFGAFGEAVGAPLVGRASLIEVKRSVRLRVQEPPPNPHPYQPSEAPDPVWERSTVTGRSYTYCNTKVLHFPTTGQVQNVWDTVRNGRIVGAVASASGNAWDWVTDRWDGFTDSLGDTWDWVRPKGPPFFSH